jgi:hypothetical protein
MEMAYRLVPRMESIPEITAAGAEVITDWPICKKINKIEPLLPCF